MNLQYVFDKNGVTTSVIIPIIEWDALKEKYAELDEEDQKFIDIPEWHKKIINERLMHSEKNPDDMLDFDTVCKEIKQEL
jgi:hypothetical protein